MLDPRRLGAWRLRALGIVKRLAGAITGNRLLAFEGQLAAMSARLLVRAAAAERAPARGL